MGTIISLISEGYPPKSKFAVDDIPNLEGKVAIVTGATSGKHCPLSSTDLHINEVHRYREGNGEGATALGRCPWMCSLVAANSSWQALLSHNATVYIGARSIEKGERTLEDLKLETGRDGVLLELDLSNLASVKKAAEVFQRSVRVLGPMFVGALLTRAKRSGHAIP